MKIDPNVVLGIIAFASVVSPIFVSISNNISQRKLKQMEIDENRKDKAFYYEIGVYEDYLRYASAISHKNCSSAWENYSKIYPLALLYFPQEFQSDLLAVDDYICKHEYAHAANVLNSLAVKIRAYLLKKGKEQISL